MQSLPFPEAAFRVLVWLLPSSQLQDWGGHGFISFFYQRYSISTEGVGAASGTQPGVAGEAGSTVRSFKTFVLSI